MLPGSRVQIKAASQDLREEIRRKKKVGSLAANDLRTCFERMLKDIFHSLEVMLAFRFDDLQQFTWTNA
jgi:hypothetical protein